MYKAEVQLLISYLEVLRKKKIGRKKLFFFQENQDASRNTWKEEGKSGQSIGGMKFLARESVDEDLVLWVKNHMKA